MKSYAGLFFFVVLLSVAVAGSVPGEVVHVAKNADGDGSGRDWNNACPSISQGVLTAESGDEVWVKQGEYREHLSIAEDVELFGGFYGNEILRSSRSLDTSLTVINAEDYELTSSVQIVGASALFDGFVLTGGTAGGANIYSSFDRGAFCTLSNCLVTGNRSSDDGGGISINESVLILNSSRIVDNTSERFGGGVHIRAKSTLIARDCTFKGNRASSPGGGICILTESWVDISDSEISHNSTPHDGGGLSCGGGFKPTTILLNNCRFENNSAGTNGGALSCEEARLEISECTISRNYSAKYGGGLCIIGGDAIIADSWISRNTSKSGGGVFYGGNDVECFNSVIAGNEATKGGAIYTLGLGTFSHCTIAGNLSSQCGGIYQEYQEYYAPPLLQNCILWNENSELGTSGLELDFVLTYCCTEGGYSGPGNIEATPEFVRPWDGEDGDFHLLPESPCIDAGTALVSITDDLDGVSRPYDLPGKGSDGVGNGYDIGAYEYFPVMVPDDLFLLSTLWHCIESETQYYSETDFDRCDVVRDGIIDSGDLLGIFRQRSIQR